jgi:hypothetical protein
MDNLAHVFVAPRIPDVTGPAQPSSLWAEPCFDRHAVPKARKVARLTSADLGRTSTRLYKRDRPCSSGDSPCPWTSSSMFSFPMI